MSAPPSRPVYVPRTSRRGGRGRGRGGGRFHGAFTGGFSAGYFNTAGSAEGWQPQEQKKALSSLDTPEEEVAPRMQRPEDFMDEQDHDEWGGPVAISRDYQENAKPALEEPKSQTDLLWSVDEAPENVGRRLLRLLGWREGQSTAYVPAEKQDATGGDTTAAASQENQFLSKKRLRKIQLQQKRVQIPSPKLDTCGLGYEPYQNAPEFQRHRERRRKLAQERAQPTGRSVYRISNVLGADIDGDDDDIADPKVRKQGKQDNGDPYVSFETTEDFVGTKSVGGFALREDDDDAYDDQPLTKVSSKIRVDTDAFDTVAYEHESDDEPIGNADDTSGADFGGALSSWANESKPSSDANVKQASRGVTADGKPPLEDFALGGTNLPNQNMRFRGPDLPEGYQVQRHVFGPNEHPLVLKALSRAVQLEVVDERRKEAMQEALDANARSIAPTRVKRDGPIAGTKFIGLAEAMKSRFTASKVSTETKHGDTTLVPGLSFVKSGGPNNDATAANTSTIAKPEIKVTRTVLSFAPEPLLCKRFSIRTPTNAVVATNDNRPAGESYFQDVILKKAGASASSIGKTKKLATQSTDTVESINAIKVPENAHIERPDLAVYKSIFEPDSESSESEDGVEEELFEEEQAKIEASVAVDQAHVDTADTSLVAVDQGPGESRIVVHGENQVGVKESAETSRHQAAARRSGSVDSSGDSSDDDRDRRKRRKKDDRRRERRRHRDDKKKKKRKKSSKRKRE